MIIYMIIKILMSYYLIIKKGWIRSNENLNMIIDMLIVMLFMLLVYNNVLNVMDNIIILKIGVTLLSSFLLYKIISNVNERKEKMIEWMEKKEKIRLFLLKPKVNKIVYYLIWALPWNIGYWTYFWVMENGWYLRVWIVSNRDIVFMKYFGWDSRDFFFNLNNKMEKVYKIIYIYEIRKRIKEVLCRIHIVLYLIRNYMIKIKIMRYVFIRIVIYMYLSIFYLFIVLNIVNFYLIIILIIVEMIILLFFAEISIYIEKKYNLNELFYYELKKKGIITQEFIEIRSLMIAPMFIDTRLKWEDNVFIWDKTLSNSVTLNILYKYMIWVNKNTEGYYDKKMNMRSRIHRKRFLEEKSVIWDILPRTRYVIANLKYIGYNTIPIIENGVNVGEEYEFTNLIKNRNFYLSYYEKAYSKTSLTLLVWILRKHQHYWIGSERIDTRYLMEEMSEFYTILQSRCKRQFLEQLIYLYIHDKRYFKIKVMLVALFNRDELYCCEELFFHYHKDHIIEKAKELEIPKKFCGMKDYKMIIKIMGRIQLYEEEVIVWNDGLQEMLRKKEELYKKEYDEVMKSEISQKDKLSYRYNKFFFEENPKDLVVLDEDLEEQCKLYFENFSQVLTLEPSLNEYYELYNKYGGYIHISAKEWFIIPYDIPEFEVKWCSWNRHSPENLLFMVYCYVCIYHYDLNKDKNKRQISNSDDVVDIYNINY